MPGIVSAIRGGPGSQPTIERSISLAGDQNLPLYFLYVVNLDFLVRTETSRTHTLLKEMSEMGDFILLQAQTKAEERGVQSTGVVRQGEVREEILNLCQEVEADYVLLGKPRGSEESDLFTHEDLDEFGHRIEEETRARVIYVETRSPDEV